MLARRWPAEPEENIARLFLERGVFELKMEFRDEAPDFADVLQVRPIHTGFQLKYAGPDTHDHAETIPHHRLFRIDTHEKLSVGASISITSRIKTARSTPWTGTIWPTTAGPCARGMRIVGCWRCKRLLPSKTSRWRGQISGLRSIRPCSSQPFGQQVEGLSRFKFNTYVIQAVQRQLKSRGADNKLSIMRVTGFESRPRPEYALNFTAILYITQIRRNWGQLSGMGEFCGWEFRS
ncbi:MAG TPA: hypothetical protein VFC46_14095 [Humisphaera sp.]|nr:hypothetical protein [Humisphaera sp.]